MEKKTFAFKLVEKSHENATQASPKKWAARDGVSVAGCTDYLFPGNLRYRTQFNSDGGDYC